MVEQSWVTYMYCFMVLVMARLRVYFLETHCNSSAHVIIRVAVTTVTAAAQVRLTWLVVHVVVVGWIFGGVGCHATSKGSELSCELDYAISFWLCILLWKYLYFV